MIPAQISYTSPKDRNADGIVGRMMRKDPLSDERGQTKILVVDDEPTIAGALVEILNGEGFDARAALSGDLAIEQAGIWHPDVVLSDVIMPGTNGVEAGIKIRELLPECRIILFSGQAGTVDLLDWAREQGHTFEILAKPLKPEVLIDVIRRGPDPSGSSEF